MRGWKAEWTHIRAAARLVRDLDLVVVTGGGALDEFWGGPWGQPWTLFKFAMLSRRYRVPFLFVSVGKCSLETELSRWFVQNALRIAAYRSYRDRESKDAARNLYSSPDDQFCPDLAYGYPLADVKTPSRDSRQQRLTVGVSPMAYCDPCAWPVKDERRYRRYLGHLAEMVKWLVKATMRLSSLRRIIVTGKISMTFRL